MKEVQCSAAAWEDYLYWQTQDKKTLRRINQLIKDIDRCPYDRIGKPEALTDTLSGYWSRRRREPRRIGRDEQRGTTAVSRLGNAY